MQETIVVHSLEELEGLKGLFDTPEPEERALVPVTVYEDAPDIEDIAEAAHRSAEELAGLVAADREARTRAEESLARYHRLQDELARLQHCGVELRGLAERANGLTATALSPATRERATVVAESSSLLATHAEARAAAIRKEAEDLSSDPNVSQLLAEERTREEARQREKEEREREARLAERIAWAEALIRDGNENEAFRVLGQLARENPNNPHVASLIETVRRRQRAVKAHAAEQALREARKLQRREPSRAAALIEAVDLAALPDPLARQAYGCWLAALRRVVDSTAVHYSPAFGRGAVLAPADDGRLEVVAAIGMRWVPGQRLSSRALRGARPLN